MYEIIVIGIGNVILKDDGFGVHVIEALKREDLPDNVLLVDGGTSSIDMMGYFVDYNNLIIVDVLKAGAKPGTIYKLSPDDLKSYKRDNLSIHSIQILDVIKMANMLGADPDVLIYGIEPYEIKYDLNLSEKIKEKVPVVVDLLIKEINSLLYKKGSD